MAEAHTASTQDSSPGGSSHLDLRTVSFVFPCLDEEDGVGPCVREAKTHIESMGYTADIVVVDNGCTDRSVERATEAGARVIHEPVQGYGQALRAGMEASEGQIIFMADADGTYDLEKIPVFVRHILDDNADLVMGNRYHKIEKGAMPFLHRYLGTPVLGCIMKTLFKMKVRDVNCGMRAFTREAYKRLNVVTTGMEFASEMVIRAINLDYKICEVNLVYHVRIGDSKLRTMRDGLRHLRLILLYSPDVVFMMPAIALWVLGAAIVIVLYPKPFFIGSRAIDVHTMLVGATMNLVGLYLGCLGIVAKAYGHFTGLRLDRLVGYWSGIFRLKHGLYFGLFSFVAGSAFVIWVVIGWFQANFGNISFIRELILGLVFVSNGIVVAATAFVLSLMVIPHTPENSSLRG